MSEPVEFGDHDGGRAAFTVAQCGCGVCGLVSVELDTGKPAYGGCRGSLFLSRKQTKKLIKVLRRLLKEEA